MFKDIIFCSVDSVASLKRPSRLALVSILDRSEESHRPDLSRFGKVLTMHFEDMFEEAQGMEPGSIADTPTDAEHAKYGWGKGERLMTLQDAKDIVDFVLKAAQDPRIETLAVHCYAGISRSAAVALFFSLKLAVPLDTCASTDFANPRVLRLLEKAFEQATVG